MITLPTPTDAVKQKPSRSFFTEPICKKYVAPLSDHAQFLPVYFSVLVRASRIETGKSAPIYPHRPKRNPLDQLAVSRSATGESGDKRVVFENPMNRTKRWALARHIKGTTAACIFIFFILFFLQVFERLRQTEQMIRPKNCTNKQKTSKEKTKSRPAFFFGLARLHKRNDSDGVKRVFSLSSSCTEQVTV